MSEATTSGDDGPRVRAADASRDSGPAASAGAFAPAGGGLVASLLSLQRTAGNAATVALLSRSRRLARQEVPSVEAEPVSGRSIPELQRALRTDAQAYWELRGRYQNMSDGQLARYARSDATAQQMLQERRFAASAWTPGDERWRGHNMPHTASGVSRDDTGAIVWQGSSWSGRQTPDERARLFPRGMNDSHTEARLVVLAELPRGGVFRITGQYDPCTACRSAMQAAANRSGCTVEYWWPGAEGTGFRALPEPAGPVTPPAIPGGAPEEPPPSTRPGGSEEPPPPSTRPSAPEEPPPPVAPATPEEQPPSSRPPPPSTPKPAPSQAPESPPAPGPAPETPAPKPPSGQPKPPAPESAEPPAHGPSTGGLIAVQGLGFISGLVIGLVLDDMFKRDWATAVATVDKHLLGYVRTARTLYATGTALFAHVEVDITTSSSHAGDLGWMPNRAKVEVYQFSVSDKAAARTSIVVDKSSWPPGSMSETTRVVFAVPVPGSM